MTPSAIAAPARLKPVLIVALGIALGFSLSRIGFTDYGELHRMFVFADLRMFFVFIGGVVVTGAGLFAIGRWRDLGVRHLSKRSVVGGVIFGLGWAIAGACPGVAFAQLGEGKLWAAASLVGMFGGTLVVQQILRRVEASKQPALLEDVEEAATC